MSLSLKHKLNVLVFLILFAAVPAWAGIPVTVDPNGYEGSHRVSYDSGSFHTGVYTYDVPSAGTYDLLVGLGGIRFTVDADGNVTSQNSTAATGGIGTLTLNTGTLTVDPDSYTGFYHFGYALTTHYTGVNTFTWVKGIRIVISPGIRNSLDAAIDADGTVRLLGDNPVENEKAVIIGNAIRFKTVDVTFDVQDFPGNWNLGYAYSTANNSQTYKLVPGGYALGITPTCGMDIRIDANGVLTSSTRPAVAWENDAVTFQTTTVNYDPGLYAYTYWVNGQGTNGAGPRSDVLVKGCRFQMTLAYWNRFFFNVASDGAVSSENVAPAYGQGDTLVFNNEEVLFTADGHTYGIWSDYIGWIGGSTIATGQTVSEILVPGVYQLYPWKVDGVTDPDFRKKGRKVTVHTPCGVDPAQIDFGDGGSLSIGCPVLDPDQDSDGIPDSIDNCPATENADQADVDGEGIGDVCDDDNDNDTVNNDVDNCPLTPNSDQHDSDGDGIGDVCDDDLDNDGVTNTKDNCSVIANSDQGDSDSDGNGDACDSDDDNDSIPDATDNCPLTSNVDQYDLDGDGEGDACDGDRDGDGIVNDDDQCDATPAGSPVNTDGCSGPQYIAMMCQESSFKNHGKYVSCVAKAANAAVEMQLIEEQDKSIFIREAAKK